MNLKSNHKDSRPPPAGRDGQKFSKIGENPGRDGEKFSKVGEEAGRDGQKF